MSLLSENISILLYGLLFSFISFVILWFIQVRTKDAGWVDIGWTLGLSSLIVYLGFNSEGFYLRRILASFFIGIWALRLVVYIIKDRLFKEFEDSRYQNLRNYWGEKANFMFFFFFTVQSLLVVLFSIPFLPIFDNQNPIGILDFIGIGLWLIAFVGEYISDKQLKDFRQLPENKFNVCRIGLWKYSRHPNYFFEWLQWISFVFLSIGSSEFYLSFIGPIFMYIFLIKLTGVHWVELQAVKKRGDAYRQYQKEVPMFFPKVKL